MLRLEQIQLIFNITRIIVNRCGRNKNHLFTIAYLMKITKAFCSLISKSMRFCSCQVRNKKKLIFFINGEPLARFPMLLLYNFVFSLLLLIIPSSSLKVIKVPSDFNMLIIIHQHIINEISDYFFIKLIQLTKLC